MLAGKLFRSRKAGEFPPNNLPTTSSTIHLRIHHPTMTMTSASELLLSTIAMGPPSPPPVISPLLPMIPVPHAIEIVLTETARALWYDRQIRNELHHDCDNNKISTSSVALPTHQQLLGRISARDITVPSPGYPDHNSSIMDGYAIKTSDLVIARDMYDSMDEVQKDEYQLDFEIVGKVYAGDDENDNDDIHDDKNNSLTKSNPFHRTAVYVTTGAVVPPNYDAVIPIEDTELISRNGDDKNDPRRRQIIPSKIKSILLSTKPWTWIRPIGCDITPGSVVLSKGEKIQPVHIALLAQVGVGLDQVHVNRLPRVGVLSTGNELVFTPYNVSRSDRMMHPQSQSRGKIPDANRPLLLSQLATYGNCIPMDLGIAMDDDGYENISHRLINVLWPENVDDDDDYENGGIDVLITTGGVSMGEKDIMERVFAEGMGGKVHFGRLNMKPGKPTTFITVDKVLGNGHIRRKLVFALPGNPVSASVCSELLVRPCLDMLHTGIGAELLSENVEQNAFIEHGVNNARVHEEIKAAITSDIELDPGRPEYRRVALSRISCNGDGDGHQYKYHASCIGVQRSSRVLSLRGADGLMILPSAGTLACGNIATRGMEFPVLLYTQLSKSSNTCFKDSFHREMWMSSHDDNARETIALGVLVVCHSDEEVVDLSSFCTTLVTLFGGDTKVTVVKRVLCKLDKPLEQQLPDIINGPLMDGVNVMIVLVPTNASANDKLCSTVSFKAGLEISHILRPIVSKNAPALALRVRSGAASYDPMAALFENIVGTVRDNSSLLVTCTDVGLAGAVNSVKGLIDHLVSYAID